MNYPRKGVCEVNLQNPYEVTTVTSVDVQTDLGLTNLESATLGKRLANHILDLIVIQLFLFGLFVILGVLEIWIHGQPESTESTLDALATPISLGFYYLYYTGFEYYLGRTPGKFVTGTRVIDESGESLTLAQTAIRSLCRFIPFDPLSIFFSDEDKCWHDSLPKAIVVSTR
ncbi:RDD family protein [Sulfidibacter corallicola]|uniref:RDD family protein n=1 Tax=Sulfidibacter corallicola TaxID=2818388 RepID=A0A8A4TPP9_SULCO|nr:RDD family protein [Sulfidibacter corallicola]QTD48555.1 RDD family protein [Sulfidibacter corallicola]